MATDYRRAQTYILSIARQKMLLTKDQLQQTGGMVMQSTGAAYSTILGQFDTRRGDLRTTGVTAGSRLFMDAAKVPAALDRLLSDWQRTLPTLSAQTHEAIYELSFDMHYQLVIIHPFGDGNGRTSRLLMNYVQHFHGLPLTLVYASDRAAYIEALELTRTQESPVPFRTFMHEQLIKLLTAEIVRLTPQPPKASPKGQGGTMLFF